MVWFSLFFESGIKFSSDTQDNQALAKRPKQYFLFLYRMDLCRSLPTMTTHKNYISLSQKASRLSRIFIVYLQQHDNSRLRKQLRQNAYSMEHEKNNIWYRNDSVSWYKNIFWSDLQVEIPMASLQLTTQLFGSVSVCAWSFGSQVRSMYQRNKQACNCHMVKTSFCNTL